MTALPPGAWRVEDAKEHYWLQYASWYTGHYYHMPLTDVRNLSQQHFQLFGAKIRQSFGNPPRPFSASSELEVPPFKELNGWIKKIDFEVCSVDQVCCKALVDSGLLTALPADRPVPNTSLRMPDQNSGRAVCQIRECYRTTHDNFVKFLNDPAETEKREDSKQQLPGPIIESHIYNFRSHVLFHHQDFFEDRKEDFGCYEQAVQANELHKYFDHHTVRVPSSESEMYACLIGDCKPQSIKLIKYFDLEGGWEAHLLEEHSMVYADSGLQWQVDQLAEFEAWRKKISQRQLGTSSPSSEPSSPSRSEEIYLDELVTRNKGRNEKYYPAPGIVPLLSSNLISDEYEELVTQQMKRDDFEPSRDWSAALRGDTDGTEHEGKELLWRNRASHGII